MMYAENLKRYGDWFAEPLPHFFDDKRPNELVSCGDSYGEDDFAELVAGFEVAVGVGAGG